MLTGSVIGQLAGINIDNTLLGRVDPASSFILEWIVRVPAYANASFRAGLMNDAAGALADPPAEGIYVEKLTGDTDIFAVCRSGGVQTKVSLLPTPSSATFYHITMRRGSATSIGFHVGEVRNWADTVNISSNVPTIRLTPWAQIKTHEASPKWLYLDAFQLAVNGLAR
jgi:hypothetical protein